MTALERLLFKAVSAFVAVCAVYTAFGLIWTASVRAADWPVEDMNAAINQTNFVIGENGGHCSGTLISLEYRLVLTNHHCIAKYVRYRNKEVVEDGEVKRMKVEDLRDVTIFQRAYADYQSVGETSYRARIVSRWEASDLALLQILAEDLPYTIEAPIFAGERVFRGETAYVVGNPQMLDTSVTKGIISSTQRTFRVPWADNQEVPFIQVDAGITGGNSGGALYNAKGEMIGVPAARGRDVTLGLAIPYFRVQEFLTANCYRDVWDKESPDLMPHEECVVEMAGTIVVSPIVQVDPSSYCGEVLEPMACGLPGFGPKEESTLYQRWLGAN